MRKTLIAALAAGMAITAFGGRVICSGGSAPVAIDSRIEPVVDTVLWDASWVGGDTNATVVITDNGSEVKRTTGTGDVTLPGIGRHELTYTTYIDGVAQDEVYTTTVYVQWKYEVVDGGAVITETTQTSGAVTIPTEIDGYPVTGIASDLFKDCAEITNMTIPESVTSIGASVFLGCSGVRDVTVPQCVCTNRMSSVFPSAYMVITNVVVLGSVTSIGASAFSGCNGLTSVTIPNGVTSIGSSAFSGCSELTSVHITDLTAWCGIIFGNSLANPLNYAHNLYLNDSLVTILEIPDGVTSVEAYAFSGCSALISVTIPSRVTSIGTSAFSGCSGLTSVHITDLAAWCEIAFGNGSANPLNWAHNLYLNNSLVTNLEIPDGVTSIEAYTFFGCSSLTSVVIPDCVTSIGTSVFSGCSGLKNVTANQYVCSSRMSSIFPAYQSITNVVLSEGVTIIGSSVFSGCSGLTSVTIPDSVTSIGNYAFINCTNLTNVTIPNSVTRIGDHAFCNCSGLTSVTIPNDVTSISSSMFSGCSRLTSVTIPDGVTSIGACAFDGCSSLTSISIPDGVTEIGTSAFRNCNGLETVIIPQYVCSRGLASVFPSTYQSITNVVVSDSVTSIADAAFSGCSALVAVTIPSSVKRIGDHAFDNCPNLQCELWDGYKVLCGWLMGYTDDAAASISDADNLHGIISWALEGCVALKELSLGENALLLSIGTGALKGCTELQSLVLPPSLEEIGDEAFMGCSYIDNVIIPKGVKRVGARAFKNCTGFTAAQIEHGVEMLGDEAFYGDWRIAEVDIPSTVTNIGVNAFGGDSSIIRVGLRGDVRPVSQIFSNYQYIREATVKAGDGAVVDGLFSNCTYLADVRILGNCPALAGNGTNLYKNTRSTLTTYVERSSTGWDGTPGSHSLPQAWPLTGNYRRSIAWWDVPTYLVRFDSNGGTLGVQDTYQYSEKPFTLPPEPVQTGYKFAGWWTKRSGGLQVTSDTVFIEGVYTTLYAHWLKGHWVFLDPNGGTVTNDFVTYIDQTVYGVLPVAVRPGYTFGGWSYNGRTLLPTTELATLSDHTITAQWEAYKYSVRFNANGGEGEMVDEVLEYDTAQTLTANAFTRRGYAFAGWATASDGEVVYSNGESVTNLTSEENGVVELYAVWQRDGSNLSFTSYGDAEWTMDTSVRHGGSVSWKSGAIDDDEHTTMQAVVNGPGVISFWWKVGCESFRTFRLDSLAFSIDGVEKTWINGSKDWAHLEFEIVGKGSHVLEWTYAKDESGYTDPDCGWVSEVVWAPRLETINDYLNCTNLVFSSDAVAWIGVTDVSHDGFGSMRSGAIGDNAESRIDAVVEGAGTISFWWRADCEASFKTYVLDHLSFFVDGVEQDFINGNSDWIQKTFLVTGDGMHTLSWVYVKDEEGVAGADCAWLDQVVWTPSGTTTGLEAWLAERSLTADARAANGRTAAECYALGLDPTLATNDFRIVSIEMVDGTPKVEWEPKTNRWTGAEIQAVLKGAATLDGEWQTVTEENKAGFRFFKVVVELP